MREAAVAGRPTASPLRLDLRAGGADRLQVRVLKRRGPPLEAPISIELPTVLSLAARRRSASESERAAALNAATFVNFA
jgi:protein ImuA